MNAAVGLQYHPAQNKQGRCNRSSVSNVGPGIRPEQEAAVMSIHHQAPVSSSIRPAPRADSLGCTADKLHGSQELAAGELHFYRKPAPQLSVRTSRPPRSSFMRAMKVRGTSISRKSNAPCRSAR